MTPNEMFQASTKRLQEAVESSRANPSSVPATIILANADGQSVVFRPQPDGTVKVTMTTIAIQEDGTRIHRMTLTKFQARVKFAKLLESGFCKW